MKTSCSQPTRSIWCHQPVGAGEKKLFVNAVTERMVSFMWLRYSCIWSCRASSRQLISIICDSSSSSSSQLSSVKTHQHHLWQPIIIIIIITICEDSASSVTAHHHHCRHHHMWSLITIICDNPATSHFCESRHEEKMVAPQLSSVTGTGKNKWRSFKKKDFINPCEILL